MKWDTATVTVIHLGPASIDLQSADNFVVIAGSTVTNTGPTLITGDLGLSPGGAVTGFPPGTVIGSINISDPTAAAAKLHLTAAYLDAAGRSLDVIVMPTNELGGLTLEPGLYKSGSSFAITSVDLTLAAIGDPSAVWIFQMPSTFTVGSGCKVTLTNGAQAENIYWQVGSSATLGTTSVVAGNILAQESITLETGATLNGRALTQIAAVTLDANTITKP
jgi:hypothetical protein